MVTDTMNVVKIDRISTESLYNTVIFKFKYLKTFKIASGLITSHLKYRHKIFFKLY